MANSNYVAPILKVRDTVEFQNIVVLHELSVVGTVSYCYLQCYNYTIYVLIFSKGYFSKNPFNLKSITKYVHIYKKDHRSRENFLNT